jgi:hypothetical protein
MLVSASAFADSKSDAQAKVDAAKTEVCVKAQKFLAEQDGKGKCKPENDEAKKVTCSASTSKSVTDLQTKCITAKPAAKDDKAAPAGLPKCRALDPKDNKVVFEEAEGKVSTACIKALIEKLQTHWCTDAANKGKSFDYMAEFDHMIGGKKSNPTTKKSLKCFTVKK